MKYKRAYRLPLEHAIVVAFATFLGAMAFLSLAAAIYHYLGTVILSVVAAAIAVGVVWFIREYEQERRNESMRIVAENEALDRALREIRYEDERVYQETVTARDPITKQAQWEHLHRIDEEQADAVKAAQPDHLNLIEDVRRQYRETLEKGLVE